MGHPFGRGAMVQKLRALADLPQLVKDHPKEATADVLSVVRVSKGLVLT